MVGETIPLERLHEEKYCKVVCYPRYDPNELRSRLRELNELGVKAIEFVGEKLAFKTPVIGKGCAGVVVIAHTSFGKVALKIRRMDACRLAMEREAEMLRMANTVCVGPRLLNVNRNFLLMEFIEGAMLPQWVKNLKGGGINSRIRRVLQIVLEQCLRLDESGLDHGELSIASKHIIIDAKDHPHIIDFESASITRKVSNVTSICHYLFIGSRMAGIMKRMLGEVDKGRLIKTLRAYKGELTQENFEKTLRVCKLQRI